MVNIVVLGGTALSQPAPTPHVAWPFTITAGGLVTVDQGSLEEVTACVSAVCACQQGQREDDPSFGIPPILFQSVPVDTNAIMAAILAQEPRAVLVVSQQINPTDASDVTIIVEVTGVTGA